MSPFPEHIRENWPQTTAEKLEAKLQEDQDEVEIPPLGSFRIRRPSK
jgi:hypothetical protein